MCNRAAAENLTGRKNQRTLGPCGRSMNLRQTLVSVDLGLAEGAGFEPALRFPANTLSKRAPSATRPPLRAGAAL